MATGEVRFGFALTEPDSGSDVARIRTSAVRDGNEWVISGAKTFIGTRPKQTPFSWRARPSRNSAFAGISMIIVEAERQGFHRGRRLHKMGSHLSGTGEFAMDQVRVPLSNLVGTDGGGMKVVMTGLNMDRITWPVHRPRRLSAGVRRDGQLHPQPQGVRADDLRFPEHAVPSRRNETELAVGRAFLDDLIRDYKRTGELDTTRCAMAKMWLPEMEARIIDQCVQLHGGAGYMDEYPVSRLYTAARCTGSSPARRRSCA
jgi:alkylation response protein AidB-like acyl-CoA dehydrogenase